MNSVILLENGQRAYYFEPEEAPANMQYLFGKTI